MKLGCGDHLGQFLHIGRLDVDDIEALVLDVEVPQIDTQIITANEGFSVAVDRYAVDVISMRIGIIPSRIGSNNGIMMSKAREFEGRSVTE